MPTPDSVLGIPCTIASRKLRRLIDYVLGAVRGHPRDWGRLKRRVLAIVYFDSSEEKPDTPAEWVVDLAHAARLQPEFGKPSWGHIDGSFNASGWIKLSHRLGTQKREDIIAVVAHECGHAVTRESEFLKRQQSNWEWASEAGADFSEWASESCADFHVFRWGFEKELRQHSTRRRIGHHGALPGQTIYIGTGPDEIALKMDRNFYLRRAKGS
jgi:hypothetical protein